MASSGNSLYAYVNNQLFGGSTTIYKSTDGGSTFSADSSGHPLLTFPASVAGKPNNVANVYVLNDKLINVVSGGYYSKYPSDAEWTKETDPNIKFSEYFGEHNNTWYAFYSNKLHTSTDNGVTWTTPTNTGIPAVLTVKVFNVNPVSGRIYVAGASTNKYNLLYSDNEGASWDSLTINQYLGTNWMGITQKMTNMISKGSNLTLTLENDAQQTQSNILNSTDGGLNFSVDTVGLLNDPNGTATPIKMLFYKDVLYLALNFQDIYKQGTGTTGITKTNLMDNVQVYPNPVNNELTIKSESNLSSIVIYNVTGKVLKKLNPHSDLIQIDLSSYVKGVYLIEMQTKSGESNRLTILKQ